MKFFQKSIPVLMYHRIGPPDAASSLTVAPESFSRQMDWLESRSFQFLSLDEVSEQRGRTGIASRAVSISFDDGFRNNYELAFPVLIQKEKPAAVFIVVNWVGQKNFMSWPEVREIAKAGITIGSHSLSHRWLPRISDARELTSEIFDSKKKIEDEIGLEVRHFSYPVGGVDERVAALVREAGYRAAWVAGARPSLSIQEPRFVLRRLKISPSDAYLPRFSLKAYGVKGLFR